MKKIVSTVVLLICCGALHAQSFNWLGVFSTKERPLNKQELQEQLRIADLQAREKVILQEGEMRAFNVNPQAIVHIVFEAASYVPINYKKEYAANCYALLLDDKGTIVMNQNCRMALMHTKKQLTLTVDFSQLLGKKSVYKISFQPKRFIYKKNYVIGQLPLPSNAAQEMQRIGAPTFVCKDKRLFVEDKPAVLKKQLTILFDNTVEETSKKIFAKALPNYFFTQIAGFSK